MLSHREVTNSLRTAKPPRLHTLKLPESPTFTNEDGSQNFERFDMAWILVDKDEKGKQLQPILPDSPTNGTQDFFIEIGDGLYFPELLTGAGEFEAFRFVGKRLVDNELPLLHGGVEYPEFPLEIVEMMAGKDESFNSLQKAYEPLFNQMLIQQPGCILSLEDLFGGDTAEYWRSPEVQRQSRRRLTVVKEWKIALNKCQLIM